MILERTAHRLYRTFLSLHKSNILNSVRIIVYNKLLMNSHGCESTCPPDSTIKPEELLMLSNATQRYALVVLNRPILHPPQFLIPFWNKALLRLTVDGGTNRWYTYLKKNNIPEKDLLRVDIVSGDFDSITPECLQRVKDDGAEIIHTPDQDETDFTKALRVIADQCVKKNIVIDSIFSIYQSSGRIDQTFANVNTIFKCLKLDILKNKNIYLLSDDSLSWLLKRGQTFISVPESLKRSPNAWCALIPVGEKCECISTFGLKWDLDGGTLEFGELVSTSNKFDGCKSLVTIQTGSPILWSMGISPLFSHWFKIPDQES